MPSTESSISTRELLLARVAFWLTVFSFVPACDLLFGVSLNGSVGRFALAAIAVTAVLTAITVSMIRHVGIRRSPTRIAIMLLLTTLFAMIHGIVIFNMINGPSDATKSLVTIP